MCEHEHSQRTSKMMFNLLDISIVLPTVKHTAFRVIQEAKKKPRIQIVIIASNCCNALSH